MAEKKEIHALIIYKRLLEYIRPHLWRFAIAVTGMVGYALTMALVSAIPYLTISGLSTKREIILNSDRIPNLPMALNFHLSAAWLPVIIFGVMGLRSFFGYLVDYQMTNIVCAP